MHLMNKVCTKKMKPSHSKGYCVLLLFHSYEFGDTVYMQVKFFRNSPYWLVSYAGCCQSCSMALPDLKLHWVFAVNVDVCTITCITAGLQLWLTNTAFLQLVLEGNQ